MYDSKDMIRRAQKDVREKFGIDLYAEEEGTARGELVLKPNHWNLYHIPYGGVQFNLADITAGVAFLNAGGYGVTISGNVNFLRASSPDTRKLICRARVTKKGRRVCFASADVEDDAGTLLASYTFTFANSNGV